MLNSVFTEAVTLFLAALAAVEALVANASDNATEDRGHPEEPQLLNGSAANEHSNSGRASRVHGGVGHGDGNQVDEGEAETDGNGSKACGSAFVSSTHDHKQEDCSEHHFDEEGAAHTEGGAAESVATSFIQLFRPAVGSESADASVGKIRMGDAVKNCSSDNTANDLCNNVSRSFLSRETTAGNLAKGNSRVQVATRNVADGISHGKNSKTEGERNANVANTSGGYAASKNCCAAATEHQPEGTDCFCNCTSTKFHVYLLENVPLYGKLFGGAKIKKALCSKCLKAGM